MPDTIFPNVLDAQPGAGMSLRGTLTQAAGQEPFSFAPNDGLQRLQERFQQGLKDAEQEAQPPIGDITLSPNDRVKVDMSGEMFREALGSMKLKKQIMQGYAQQAEQLKQREDQLKGSVGGTIANVLATVAGNLAANDPKLPGWVRGLGAASLQLNPTAQQLGQQRMGLEKVLMEAAGEQASTAGNMAVQLSRSEEAKEQLRAALADKDRLRRDTETKTLMDRYTKRIKDTKEAPSFEMFAKQAGRIKGLTGEEIGVLHQDLLQARDDQITSDEKERGEKRQDKIDTATTIGRALIPLREQNAEKLAQFRNGLARQLMDKRHQDKFRGYLERMDADRLNEMAKVPKEELQRMEALAAMRNFVGRLRGFIGSSGALKEYTGGISGLLTQKLPTALAGEQRQVLQHLDVIEKMRAIKFGEGGVRGWAPGEDLIRKIGVTMGNSPKAADKIMDEILKQIELEQRVIVSPRKYAPWDKMPELFGGPDSRYYQEVAPTARQFYDEIQGVASRAGSSPSAAADPDYDWSYVPDSKVPGGYRAVPPKKKR